MAGNKINTKSKVKDERGKTNKVVTQTNEDSEDLDFTLLRKPILTSITGFAQARKIFDFATEELRDLLSNECDLLYECKVCRNIFRSLANFISHKRVYCKEKFNSSVHGHFIKTSSTLNELLKIRHTEEGYQESLKNKSNSVENAQKDHLNDDRIPISKDLTTVVENITKSKGTYEPTEENQQVVVQKIPSSNVAVYQNVKLGSEKHSDNMRAQVKELDDILSQDKAVLQSDGNFIIESSKDNAGKISTDTENVIQISDDEENGDGHILKCKICDLQFSTQKTLKFHMKYKHLESRLVYPCPDCLEIFSTSWSVYRHLFKVHRKSAAQIRRLRESIQAKAFKMNNPPAFYEKRKNTMKPTQTQKITEEERLDQENQAWMDNMEGDGEVPRCGGCGRTFERRAALAAHTYTCQPRSRALARRPEGKKIEIQIRKDYNKGPVTGLTIQKPDAMVTKPVIGSQNLPTVNTLQPEVKKATEEEEKEIDDAPMDAGDDEQQDSSESPEKNEEVNPEIDIKAVIRLPFAVQMEKSNLAAFKQRVQPEIDAVKLLCKKCDAKCDSILELYEHMADHFKWMRYACKLCTYKHYNFDKLPEHVKTVHKLKGDSDFYFSTVKAIDGTEAMIISRCLVESESTDDTNDANETSPDSRRPSRCSSDSSRLSDDSSSSSTLKENSSRKRKIYHSKTNVKRKKECISNDDVEDRDRNGDVPMDRGNKAVKTEKDTTMSIKAFEENSSDIDDIEDKITKRHIVDDTSSVASRRPVRKKTKRKNEDFEYDLSNLLKMEAQGYRDSQYVTNTKTTQSKKKTQSEIASNYENINKDCCGALSSMSKKAVDKSAAQMKNTSFGNYTVQKEQRSSSVFVRPMLPKTLSRSDKMSPKKDSTDDSSPNKVSKATETITSPNKETIINKPNKVYTKNDEVNDSEAVTENLIDNIQPNSNDNTVADDPLKLDKNSETETSEKNKPSLGIPAVVPIKFRRQSLDIMKPIINKNITDLTKAGMKTKILVIKPINRNKDGAPTVNTSLKFQTIKLKDPKMRSSTEYKSSDQVVVVKVPKVDCTIPRPIADSGDKFTSVTNINNNQDVDSIINENTKLEGTENKSDKDVTCSSSNKICDNANSEPKTNADSESDILKDLKEQSPILPECSKSNNVNL